MIEFDARGMPTAYVMSFLPPGRVWFSGCVMGFVWPVDAPVVVNRLTAVYCLISWFPCSDAFCVLLSSNFTSTWLVS